MNLPMNLSERITFLLRQLYEQQGYRRYKMSKFEPYDLYADNKDFLICDRVITFTDGSGRLMAMKPDVTLSIVKNSRPETGIQKLYYNENVYRTAGTGAFKEIMQVGLECLGQIDDYCTCEVLQLAAESLSSIRPDSVLAISHLGFLSQLIDDLGIPESKKAAFFRCIGRKSSHELALLCSASGISAENTEILKQVCATSGDAAVVLAQMKVLLAGVTDLALLEQLEQIITALDTSAKLRIDFSVVDDIRYYSGIVFKGFVPGLPGSILSGGQYDKLMKKMDRKGGAIGFAIYLDMLERLETLPEYDVDTLLLYDSTTSLSQLRSCIRELNRQGIRVIAQPQKPESIRFRQQMILENREVKRLEDCT